MEDVKQNKWRMGSTASPASLKDVLKDVPHVRRVQLVAEKFGVRARPDVHCFRHLWIEDRDENGVDQLPVDWGYFIISVNEHGFYVGVGDGCCWSFNEDELVGWDRLEEWFETQIKLAAVKKVQDS